MDHANGFLLSLAIVLGVAALTTVVFQKLKQPVVLGYLLAGLIVGPHTPIPLFADLGVIQELSELGVILLMFSIGLEFRLGKLLKLAPTAGIVAFLQCALMICLGYVVGLRLGWTSLESLYAGAVIAISSTTIIAKVFDEAGIKGKLTELVYGILIVEDLIAILLLTLFAAISAGGSVSFQEFVYTAGALAIFLIALLFFGMLIVPRFIRFVVRMRRHETTLIAAVGLCFAVALLAKFFGYSVALGAFLAGALVAESGEAQVENLVRPVRDVFSAVFFVAVGMLIDPALIVRHWGTVLIFTLLVIVGKFVGVFMGCFLTGFGIRTSVKAGLSLAQIGEFSFIIASVGVTSGAVGGSLYSLAVAVSGLTALTTPWLIRVSDPVARSIDRKLPRPLQTFVALYGSWIENLRSTAIGGEDKSRVRRVAFFLLIDSIFLLAIAGVTSVTLDQSSALVTSSLPISPGWSRAVVLFVSALLATPFVIGIIRSSQGLGWALAQRSLPRPEGGKAGEGVLDLAAAPRKAFVVTLQLSILFVVGLAFLALSQSFLPLSYGLGAFLLCLTVLGVIFWRSAESLQGHFTAGAKMILEALSSPQTPEPQELARKIEQTLPGLGTIASFKLQGDHQAVGKTLAQINLRGMTGASVIAIKRGENDVTVPSGHESLKAGDILVLTGSDSAIDAAKEFLA